MDKSKKNKLNQAINFIEELSWLLETKRNLSFREIPSILREYIESENNEEIDTRSKKKNSLNSKFLVGELPSLFLDEDLFQSREDILDFAETVLKLPVSRAGKRSRTEYIGWIVCEVTKLNDKQLSELVNALDIITGNDLKLKQIKEAKKMPNFSWNDAISKIGKN